LEATVHYRYHPYFNQTFKILQRGGSVRSQLTLEKSPGKTFAIPIWMVEPAALDFCVSNSVTVDSQIYLSIIALLDTNCFSADSFSAAETTNGSTRL